jgi:hypothetical protein
MSVAGFVYRPRGHGDQSHLELAMCFDHVARFIINADHTSDATQPWLASHQLIQS